VSLPLNLAQVKWYSVEALSWLQLETSSDQKHHRDVCNINRKCCKDRIIRNLRLLVAKMQHFLKGMILKVIQSQIWDYDPSEIKEDYCMFRLVTT
jgi:hypothetical protein